jgi:hypothetical protein
MPQRRRQIAGTARIPRVASIVYSHSPHPLQSQREINQMSQFTPPKLANGKQPDQNPQSLQKQGNDKTMTSPIQKIFFGCPGTGKSHQISNDIDGGIVKKKSGH